MILTSFWCPGTYPETPVGQKGVQVGPGIVFYRCLVGFGVRLGPPLGHFRATFRYFSDFSEHFRRLFSITLFLSFRAGSVTPRTLKTQQNHHRVARKHSFPKIRNVGSGSRFWLHFGHLLASLRRHFRPSGRQSDAFYAMFLPSHSSCQNDGK